MNYLFLFISFFLLTPQAYTSSLVFEVNSIQPGNLVDEYGLTPSLELELVVDVLAYENSDTKNNFFNENNLLFEQVVDPLVSMELVKIPLPDILSMNDTPFVYKLNKVDLKKKLNRLAIKNKIKNPKFYLLIQLAEKSNTGFCRFKICYQNLTKTMYGDLLDLSKKYFSKLKKQYSKAQINKEVDINVSQLDLLNKKVKVLNVVPLVYLLDELSKKKSLQRKKQESKINEPFWVEPIKEYKNQYHVGGIVRISQ